MCTRASVSQRREDPLGGLTLYFHDTSPFSPSCLVTVRVPVTSTPYCRGGKRLDSREFREKNFLIRVHKRFASSYATFRRRRKNVLYARSFSVENVERNANARLETRNNVNPNVLFTYFLLVSLSFFFCETRDFRVEKKTIKATFKIARESRYLFMYGAVGKEIDNGVVIECISARQRGIVGTLDQTVKDRNGRMQECKRIVKGSRSLPDCRVRASESSTRGDQGKRRERIFPDTFAGRRHLLFWSTVRRRPGDACRPRRTRKKRSLKAVISALVSVLTCTHENFSTLENL